jgi:hypothetical protein
MVFNATFSNISAILWQSVLLMTETGENHFGRNYIVIHFLGLICVFFRCLSYGIIYCVFLYAILSHSGDTTLCDKVSR